MGNLSEFLMEELNVATAFTIPIFGGIEVAEGRMSWDHTAVLVAIKGYEPYFDVERGTFHVVDDEGTNNWVANPNGRDLRLIEKMPPTEVASLIENYMMHQPSIK